MAYQLENLDELLCTSALGSYDTILANHITNKATGQVFDMDNLVMMDVKNINYMFSGYNKKACAKTLIVLEIKIQRFLSLHRHVQGKFLRGQAATADSILPILSKMDQDYTATFSGIGTEDKDVEYAVTPVIFNYPEKVIPFLAYWEVVIAPMKSVVDKSKLDYLLHISRRYTPA